MKLRFGWISVITASALLFAACGGGDDGGENGGTTGGANAAIAAEAIDGMVASGIDRDDAECYVNALLDEFGAAELIALGDGSDVPPEVGLRVLELFDECGLGFGEFGGGESGEMPSDFRELAAPRDQVDGPYTYGDDADLDKEWDACEAGSGTACDDLFWQSPVGSEYEAFGNTCGNRMELNYVCSLLDE